MAGLDAVVQRPQADGGLACGVDDSDNDNVYLGRTASEQECDLMIEALRRELHGIKVRFLACSSVRSASRKYRWYTGRSVASAFTLPFIYI